MRQLRTMSRWLLRSGLALGISVGLSLPYADATDDGHSAMESTGFDATTSAAIGTETNKRWVSSVAILNDGKVLLRTLPTVSKQISVGRATLVPYIGAGFRGGYATEVDRSLNTAPSSPFSSSGSTDVGLKSLSGQMIPNEVQLGIRFPF